MVLLPGIGDSTARWKPLGKRLRHHYDVTVAPLPGLGPAERFSVDSAAATVAATLPRSGRPVTVCGIGLGAMVALSLAAEHPEQVDRLVLLTRQVALSPVLMSLPAAVLRLLPATTVERLGAGQDQILALLDQVRPVDARDLAGRVDVPAEVLCGARDRINRRASAALASALPRGQLRLIPRAGADWLTPESLAEALLND